MKVILKKIPLYESFDFDSEDENLDVIIESYRYKKFIEDNYDINGAQIRLYKKDGMLFIDVDGDVMVKNIELSSLTNGQFCFGRVKGNFGCSNCRLLTSLEGAPEKVERNFNCGFCSSLTSLKGAPKEVGKNFNCEYCQSLISIKGAPEKVGMDFNCPNCKSLISLEGAPKVVGGNFKCCGCESLKSLKGVSSKVDGTLIVGGVSL